jgi:hypothetical protein
MDITRIGPVSILWITPTYQLVNNLCARGIWYVRDTVRPQNIAFGPFLVFEGYRFQSKPKIDLV